MFRSAVKYFTIISLVLFLMNWGWAAITPGIYSQHKNYNSYRGAPVDSDTTSLPYPFTDRYGDRFGPYQDSRGLYLHDPSNVKETIEYDPKDGVYYIDERMGNLFYRNPSYLTFDEFVEHEFHNSTVKYWRDRSDEGGTAAKKGLIPKIFVKSQVFDRIFGGNTIDIRPQGSAELTFGVNISKNDNPALPVKQRKITTFDFKEKIQMNVIGNIGDKMKLQTNYNTEATFDFENKMKLEYTGYEDEIIKKIEAGNVSLPLRGTLITGSQSLFGLKTELQFGRMTVTSIFSQQKGESRSVDVQGGAQTTFFEVKGDQYEANKHYFLAQYFRNQYDHALSNLPIVQSGVNITKIEVWVTNRTSVVENTRDIIAFTDLGESNFDNTAQFITNTIPNAPPNDSANSLYTNLATAGILQGIRNANQSSQLLGPLTQLYNFTDPKNYTVVNFARKLNPNEFTLNQRLGYISLNQALNADEVLAVSFEYTLNGHTYRVGDFSTGGINAPQALFVKMLKSTNVSTSLFTWDLMMKNIYSLGTYNLSQENFQMQVLFLDDNIGSYINYIPDGCSTIKGVPLLTVFNLDRLNNNNDQQPDGVFDFVDGITVNRSTGRIIFPEIEPFGNYLAQKLCNDPILTSRYVYSALYDSTKSKAQQQPEKNKFMLRGSYQGTSGSDIPLNAVNIPEGSVKVTAGGVPLTENVDYTVDYTLGRVKIINEGLLSSNAPIHVSLESNALFSIQTKTLLGSRFDYTFNKDFAVGATIMRLTERPLTNKITIGDEPIANTIWGVDGTYRTNSRFLTKLVDKIPFINTKEESNVTFNGEFADLIPGHSKAIGSTGTSYIDDFEGSKTPIDIKSPSSWILASVPQDPTMFPEASYIDSLPYGFNRAKFAWYYIDPLFQRTIDNTTPSNITPQDMLNHFVREVPEQEIFPNKAVRNNQPTTLTCLNLAFYPRERGPYNYDVNATSISSGLNADGTLANPASRWGGIMRKIEPTDFESSNIEFIEFWLMDPFNSDYGPGNSTPGGDLYFNLGNISEDILRDGRKSFENGLPAVTNNNTTDSTAWGVVPVIQSIVQAFDNSEAARKQQDVGLDGLSDDGERNYFSNYISQVAAAFGSNSPAAINANADPSADDYSYFRSGTYTAQAAKPLQRYKKYNGMEGNSPTPPYSDNEAGQPQGGYPTTATNIPDAEDINRDNTLSKEENYFQYHIEIKPGSMVVGTNFITDKVETPVSNQTAITWYHFKIPLKSPQSVVGNIEDFKSIRFARMFLTNFSDSIILRFARLDLVRSEWRKYESSLLDPGEQINTNTGTSFDVSTVNIEENGQRQPVNYVLPPGIARETDISTTNLAQLNEQSLTLKVCDLEDGDARAAYKTTQFDVRTYKRLKMYIHAESVIGSPPLQDKELSAFIRLGSDFTGNYYEYEVPLYVTPPGTTSPDAIWPIANTIDLETAKLIDAKLNRNSIGWNRNAPYTVMDGNNKITVMGNPNISGIRVIMIGVRNIKDNEAASGPAKCGEVWVDELRVSDFDEQGGWAATARVNAQLADFGTVALVGNRSTIGWGTIEQKVGERKKEDVISYDLSTSLELGKFFPERTGLKIPMYFGYAESFTNPQYNPLDPDVLFNNALNAAPNPEYRDSIKRAVQDYTMRKSINFTNVRKNKAGGGTGSSHIYDVENFNFTYSYNEVYNRNITTEYRTAKTYRGAIGYNFQAKPSSFSPFGKMFGKSPYLKLIKDFNINYVPLTNFSFRTDVDRAYTETQLRNNNVGLVYTQPPTFDKSFTMNRLYDIKLDLTKSIKIDFNAAANARIDEPPGKIDDTGIRPGFTRRDSVRQNFWNMGRLTQYRHSANVDYTLPLAKFPITDWVTVPLKYGADYNWNSAPLQYDSSTATYKPNSLANTISNSQTIQVNPSFNLVTLYNKVSFLKKVNAGPPPRQPKPPKTAATDTAKAKIPVPVIKKPKEKTISPLVRGFFRTLMSVRTANITYSETNGTLLPGFKPEPQFLGQDWGNPSAPGTDFIFGSQADIRPRAISNNWITTDTTLNNAYITTHLTNMSGRVTIEPFKNFRIELNATRNYSLNHQEYFKADGQGGFHSFSPTESGNFTISWLSYKTSFVKDASDYSNATFEQFDKNRAIFSQQLGGPSNGYGLTQQDVLTYSFLAAYTGHDANTYKRDQFPKIPRPNWRITYDGLGKLKWAQQYVTQVNLNHSYKSTYSVNSFIQNLAWSDANDLGERAFDINQNFIPQYDIQQVSITEQWGPLIGIDITWKNGLQTRTEIKRDRTVALSYSNIQVTEVRGNEYVIGAGYRIKNFKLPFGLGAKNKSKRNDLNLKADFSYRNNYTIIRQLIQHINQPSAGNKTLSIKTSADYVLNERLNIRLFYDQTINEPFVSSSFPTSNTNIGLSLRFTIAQ